MNTTTRVVSICGGVLIAAGLLAYAGFRGMTSPGPRATTVPVSQIEQVDEQTALVQRGAYLMTAMACQDCHTPKGPDHKPVPGMVMAGHPANAPLPEWDPSLMERNIVATIAPTLTAFAGPFGTSIAPNLTPDPETGIGTMTADQLIISWRTGKHWQFDRPVLPPMPVEYFKGLTDEDIRALHAFLMTLPPVKNKAPDSIMAPPPPGAHG